MTGRRSRAVRAEIHGDGGWRDHLVFALTAVEVATDHAGYGVLRRLHREHPSPAPTG